jgi:hypothetical protein
MSKPIGLEDLKHIFRDDRLHLAIGLVKQMHIPDDRSVLQVKVLILPDMLNMICKMTWDAVGPDAGVFQFPSVDDLVIVGYLDGNENEAYVLKRCTSKVDKIPMQALNGHLVLRSLAGKKAWLTSDDNVFLSRGDTAPTERLVLGDTFKTAYSTDLDETSKHKHIGNLGYLTMVPDNAAAFTALKASPVDDALMLSDLSKTEK